MILCSVNINSRDTNAQSKKKKKTLITEKKKDHKEGRSKPMNLIIFQGS